MGRVRVREDGEGEEAVRVRRLDLSTTCHMSHRVFASYYLHTGTVPVIKIKS